jgi:hypothetical protein
MYSLPKAEKSVAELEARLAKKGNP